MAESTLRIGFVGAGGIVRQRHAPGLQAIEGVELVGVANRSRESSERAAEDLGLPKVFEDWRELVRSDEIDAVVIGTHPYMHREITLAALDAGKHVFSQARMAMDYQDAKAMWEAARKSDRTTMLSIPPHYLRGDRAVRRLLNEGFVGQPLNVVVRSFSDAYANPSSPVHWRQEGKISGYNTLDVGMMIEVMHRWLGYAKRVTAMEKYVYPTRPAGDGGRAAVERPDTLSAVAELENGALATMSWSGVAQHAAGGNSFEIFGSDGTIRYLFAGDKILVGKAGDAELRHLELGPGEERQWDAETSFVEAVRSGKRSAEPSFWDGLKYMEMTEAIFRSAKEGRVVEMPFEQLERDG
jgi:predicted dehydrogenase